jgi:hypothetical protein
MWYTEQSSRGETVSEERWERRDRKLAKRRSLKMVVSNRGLKTTILPMLGKRAQQAKPKENQRADVR